MSQRELSTGRLGLKINSSRNLHHITSSGSKFHEPKKTIAFKGSTLKLD